MRITVTVFKTGLQLESDLSRETRRLQRSKGLGYKAACAQAEANLDPVHYTQVINTDSEELLKNDALHTLGQHIANGAPFEIERE
jgi:hypothetical protein